METIQTQVVSPLYGLYIERERKTSLLREKERLTCELRTVIVWMLLYWLIYSLK